MVTACLEVARHPRLWSSSMPKQCEKCGWKLYSDRNIDCPKCSPRIKKERQSHWLSLHAYPVDNFATWSKQEAGKWYKSWCRGIPRYSCSCQGNWMAYTSIQGNEPNFNSPKGFFDWSVRAHNFVSENHANPRKPPMELAKAEILYSVPWKE